MHYNIIDLRYKFFRYKTKINSIYIVGLGSKAPSQQIYYFKKQINVIYYGQIVRRIKCIKGTSKFCKYDKWHVVWDRRIGHTHYVRSVIQISHYDSIFQTKSMSVMIGIFLMI